MKVFSTTPVPNPLPQKHGFPIPEFIRDLFNKIFRKEHSFYTRGESPALTIPEYQEYSYRGVPIRLISRLTIKYDDPVLPIEVHTVHRRPDGTILKITKVLTDQTLDQLGIVEPPNTAGV